MGDTLQLKLNSDYRAKIDSIFQYVQEQKKCLKCMVIHQVYFLLLAFLAFTIFLIKKDSKIDNFIYRRVDEKQKIKKRNYAWAILWFIDSILLFSALICLDVIHNPKNFWFSHADALLAVASIIAIIGAIWAIFARIDAERAFLKSEETFDKSHLTYLKSEEALQKSSETLDAFGANFNFFEVLKDNRVGGIIDKISYDNFDISLFLGFPIIGYLYDNKSMMLEPSIDAKFDKLIYNIERLIMRLKFYSDEGETVNAAFKVKYPDFMDIIGNDKKIKNAAFSIAVFSKTESLNLLDAYYSKPQNSQIGETEKSSVKSKVEAFYKILGDVEKYSKCYESNKIKVIYKSKDEDKNHFMGTNENLRFASIKDSSKEIQLYQQQKSMIWIVNDLSKNNPDFDSSVFQTSDGNLYKVLQSVFN